MALQHIIVALGVFAIAANAQITADNFVGTPEDFFDAIFGTVSGVIITSAAFTGSPLSFGNFSMGMNEIGFDSGVILSSGNAADINGPNSNSGTGTNFGLPGDPDLASISASGVSNDASVFMIEFEATEPVIFTINFVFASEEYNEFLEFEDPFGFFVDGTNIALTPTGDAITVSNINCGDTGVDLSGPNCNLFINNDLEFSPFNIEFDGFTIVLTATSQVLDVGPHTIKLAISDEADFVLDSAVFIEGTAELIPVPTIKSDPHIQGFRGQEFDFQGQPGSVYSFLSCAGLEMNALLEDAYTSGFSVQKGALDSDGDLTLLSFQKKGTWATQVGFVFQSPEDDSIHTVSITAEPSESMNPNRVKFGSIVIDQQLQIETLGKYEIAPGIGLDISNSKSFTRINVTYQALNFKAVVDVVSPPFLQGEVGNTGDIDPAQLWHINIQIASFNARADAHGVIGQTVKPHKNGIEGVEDDYMVKDGLLGHDFAYDRFFSAPTPRRQLKQATGSGADNGKTFIIEESDLILLEELSGSPDEISKMATSDFDSLFQIKTEASKASVYPDKLVGAINRTATGETTVLEETQSIKKAIVEEQKNSAAGTMDTEEAIKNRESLLRVSALLSFGKSE